MKREYASEPQSTSVTKLTPALAEIILVENITTEERPGMDAKEPVTVWIADEYSLYVPWRDNLLESVQGARGAWLEKAKAKEVEDLLPKKVAELTEACYAAIIKGCSVELSDGTTEHFAMEETDQINLTAALSAVEQGAAGYPYHADGKLCRIYTAADIQKIAEAATAHKLYHTTYCNHTLTWARRSKTGDELASIFYGAPLPEDLAKNMAEVLKNAKGD